LLNAWNTVFRFQYRLYLEYESFGPQRNADGHHTYDYADRQRYHSPGVFEPIPVYSEQGIIERIVRTSKIGDHYADGPRPFQYYVWAPEKTLSASAKVPMVIVLPAAGNDARMTAINSGFVSLSAEKEFIVIAPEWFKKASNGEMDAETIHDAIEEVIKEYPVDRDRIYVSSLGGGEIRTSKGIFAGDEPPSVSLALY
jgi:hypothetical protein